MMKKRLLALLLAAALGLSLCACGDSDAASSESPSADPDAEATLEVDLSQDIIAFSAGLGADDALITVNGDGVPADLFLYWLFYNCYYLEYMYYYYGYTVDMFADALLDDTVDMAAYYTVLRQKAVELGCPLTDEQLAEAADSFPGGDVTIDDLKLWYGFTDASLDYISTLDYYYTNVLDALVPEPSDEELDNYAFQVKHILLATIDLTTGDALDDDAIAEKRALAEDLLARLQAVEGEEQLALFDELMNEYSEDTGLEYYPDGYEYTVDDSLVEGFTEAALALKPGEISGIVETSYGYHIMLRGELSDRDYSAEAYRDAQMYALREQWIEEADVVRSDLLDSLDVVDFYDRYMAYQQAVYEDEAAVG